MFSQTLLVKNKDLILATVFILSGITTQLFEYDFISMETLNKLWPEIIDGLNEVLQVVKSFFFKVA